MSWWHFYVPYHSHFFTPNYPVNLLSTNMFMNDCNILLKTKLKEHQNRKIYSWIYLKSELQRRERRVILELKNCRPLIYIFPLYLFLDPVAWLKKVCCYTWMAIKLMDSVQVKTTMMFINTIMNFALNKKQLMGWDLVYICSFNYSLLFLSGRKFLVMKIVAKRKAWLKEGWGKHHKMNNCMNNGISGLTLSLFF